MISEPPANVGGFLCDFRFVFSESGFRRNFSRPSAYCNGNTIKLGSSGMTGE
jgi:hypothetical protein